MQIEALPITQNGVRDIAQVMDMAAYVKAGGVFDAECLDSHHIGEWAKNPILIARLEDGSEFFHDGHHRLLGIYLGGRSVVYPSEWEVFDITYAHYQEVNFETNWLTPFCIRTEVRTGDVDAFKRHVLTLPREGAEEWVRSHRHLYCQPRNGLNTVADLARHLGLSPL